MELGGEEKGGGDGLCLGGEREKREGRMDEKI